LIKSKDLLFSERSLNSKKESTVWAANKFFFYIIRKSSLDLKFIILEGSVLDPHSFNPDSDPDPIYNLNFGSGTGSWIRIQTFSKKSASFRDFCVQLAY
jgi:hypothetical protein